MKVSFTKQGLVFHLRMWALPMVLVAVYVLQRLFPGIRWNGVLWASYPRWWQFFTCNFICNDLLHLATNIGFLVVVYHQFARHVRFLIFALAFCIFATLSSWIFYEWIMPDCYYLMGASGGAYGLLGFFSWFLRSARIYFSEKYKWLQLPILPVMGVAIIGECLFALWRMPTLAWHLHAIGFCLGIALAQTIQGFQVLIYWLADHERSSLKKLSAPGISLYRQIRQLVTIPAEESSGSM